MMDVQNLEVFAETDNLQIFKKIKVNNFQFLALTILFFCDEFTHILLTQSWKKLFPS